MTDLTRQHVRKILEARMLDETSRATAIRDLEASGKRLIDSGQTDRLEDGTSVWEIRDWRTKEVLAGGTGDDGYDDACKELDPAGTWLHIDNVEDTLTEPVTGGLPHSLGHALDDWVGATSTPDEDIAEWVGWSVEKVRRCRSES
jgi:hypothetical protein